MTAFHDIALLTAGPNWHHGGFGWIPFGLFWVAVLGTAIWLLVRAAKPHERSGVERASDILAERYARGELNREEYRERLAELREAQ